MPGMPPSPSRTTHAPHPSLPAVITAFFPDRDSADRGFRLVTEHGYEPYEIDVLMSGETHEVNYASPAVTIPPASLVAGPPANKDRAESGEDRGAAPPSAPGAHAHDPARVAQGAGIGGAVGGAVGLVAAALLAAGASVSFPALGLVMAGPMAALVSGGAAGGLTGSLIGALIGWGVPERHAGQIDQAVRSGGIVLSLTPHNAEDAAAISESWLRMEAQLLAG